MKRFFAFFLAAVFALLWGGVAQAEMYLVKRGDTLSQIAERELGSWKRYSEIAAINGISDPNKISVGQEIYLPAGAVAPEVIVIEKTAKKAVSEVVTIESNKGTVTNPIPYTDDKVGADPWNGSFAQAMDLLGISVPDGEVRFSDLGTESLQSGESFRMVSGKNKVNWYRSELSEGKSRVQKLGIVVAGNNIASVWQKPECANFLLRVGVPEVPVVGTPFVPSVPAGPSYVPAEPEGEGFVYIPPREEEYVIEHEPIVGAWMWQNDLARGWGAYGEYLAWLRKGYDYEFQDGWSPGIGIYGIYSEGESRTNTYEWIEKGIGPQVGLKYMSPTFQWQGKIRLIWEEMSGSNSEGYSMEQDNLKIGGYTEAIWRESKEFYWGLIGEAWYALDKDRTSTWSGDSPSRRGSLAVNAFGQWKLTDDWQFRASGGIFHQAWDHLTGVRLQPELRWKETVMLGPWVSFYPFGISDVYEGIASAGDLTTYGLFVRIEFGNLIRDYYKEKRMERIKAEDQAWFEGLGSIDS
ncbi:MAG: LysM peptidoglycan-binding domain-containing protein [Candidatus Moranbacteria bacterium]|jgi:hypothetical protein|nr:LysM peptidoglycan-binding domain-containing protein [Candidatus Moranbacteria bacterium]MDD5652188.1 LysM peptidoglycan-binding domain-containing protein [Candidatus Moranbacteria bacterium]MDX9855690.1 LysM peptidoglycan-binding domain-containing protein [Candidatus Moranbacteria bacterium]